MEKQKQQPQRLQSLDALRGFDMLFIMGGASLFVALATIVSESFFSGDSPGRWNMWNGTDWRITTRSSHCSSLLRVSRFRSH